MGGVRCPLLSDRGPAAALIKPLLGWYRLDLAFLERAQLRPELVQHGGRSTWQQQQLAGCSGLMKPHGQLSEAGQAPGWGWQQGAGGCRWSRGMGEGGAELPKAFRAALQRSCLTSCRNIRPCCAVPCRVVPCRAVPCSHLPLQRKQSRTWSTKALPAPAMAWAAAAVRAWHSLGGRRGVSLAARGACPGCGVPGTSPEVAGSCGREGSGPCQDGDDPAPRPGDTPWGWHPAPRGWESWGSCPWGEQGGCGQASSQAYIENQEIPFKCKEKHSAVRVTELRSRLPRSLHPWRRPNPTAHGALGRNPQISQHVPTRLAPAAPSPCSPPGPCITKPQTRARVRIPRAPPISAAYFSEFFAFLLAGHVPPVPAQPPAPGEPRLGQGLGREGRRAGGSPRAAHTGSTAGLCCCWTPSAPWRSSWGSTRQRAAHRLCQKWDTAESAVKSSK